MIIIHDPYGGKKKYNYRAEATVADFTDFLASEAAGTKLELVGEVLPHPKGASGYKYKKYGDWKKEKGWAYLLSVGGRVVKIGMTDTTLNSRFSSYQAGTLKAREKGTCSVTNYYVSEMMRRAMELGCAEACNIKIYALKVPHSEVELNVLGEVQVVRQKMAHVFETRLLELYRKFHGNYPCLSNNSSES